MSQAESWPEHIDLASLVDARTSLRAALAHLEQGSASDSDIAAIQRALGKLSVLTNDRLWTLLEKAAQTLNQTTPAPPEASADTEASRRLAEALLAEATSNTGPAAHQAVQTDQMGWAFEVARQQVHIFVRTAQDFADQPAPPIANAKARSEWINVAKVILEKAIDLITNVAVAAAFTVSAVQMAAQRTALGAADLAEQAATHIGPMLPSLLAVTVVAAHATMGVKLLSDSRQPLAAAGPRQAAEQPDRLDPAAPPSSALNRDEVRKRFIDTLDEEVARLDAIKAAEQEANRVGSTGGTTRHILGEASGISRSASYPAGEHEPVDDAAPATKMSTNNQRTNDWLDENFRPHDEGIAGRSLDTDEAELVLGPENQESWVVAEDDIPARIDPYDPRQSRPGRESPPDAAPPF